MSNEVKVKTIHDQSGPGISGETLTAEQVDVLRETRELMVLMLDAGANHDAVKQMEKVIEIKWGTDTLREVQRRTDDPERDDEAELPNPSQNVENVTIAQPGVQMSLAESFAKDPNRAVDYFENQERQRTAKEQADAKRIAHWALGGGAKP